MAKCQFCGGPAIVTVGWPGDFRWCEMCQRDLADFAKIEFPKGKSVAATDETAVLRYRAELKIRERDFMLKRVKERNGIK